jgi:UDP-N-acetylglucosamine--N-acetylmuramyl-(pentapeptide) pyrophosphoryl-undecaprenol N-acetylglucosamine transferase
MADIYALSDLVISRSGASAIFELLYLKKPMLLIPLSRRASRGDQILNAKDFCSKGYANMLSEEDVIEDATDTKFETENMYNENELSMARGDNIFLRKINETIQNSSEYIKNMESADIRNSKDIIIEEIKKLI